MTDEATHSTESSLNPKDFSLSSITSEHPVSSEALAYLAEIDRAIADRHIFESLMEHYYYMGSKCYQKDLIVTVVVITLLHQK